MKTPHRIFTPRPVLLTKAGLESLETELAEQVVARKDAVMHLSKAREMGDLSENGYYKSYKAKLGAIDGRMRRIRHMLRYGKIIANPHTDTVQIGSHVKLLVGGKTLAYDIVGEQEANPALGRISNVSPLGTKLIGKKAGDRIEILGPVKIIVYTITSVL